MCLGTPAGSGLLLLYTASQWGTHALDGVSPFKSGKSSGGIERLKHSPKKVFNMLAFSAPVLAIHQFFESVSMVDTF